MPVARGQAARMGSMGWGDAHAAWRDDSASTDLCLLYGMLCSADVVELLNDGVGQGCVGPPSSFVRARQRVLARGEHIGLLDVAFFTATLSTSRRERTARTR